MTIAELKKGIGVEFDALTVKDIDGYTLRKYDEGSDVVRYTIDFRLNLCEAYIDNTPEMEKSLDLNFTFRNGVLQAVITEPESGGHRTMNESVAPFNADALQDFACDIGMEIYSWLSLWAEEYNENY